MHAARGFQLSLPLAPILRACGPSSGTANAHEQRRGSPTSTGTNVEIYPGTLGSSRVEGATSMEPCDQHQSIKSTSTRHSVSHTSLAISSRPQVIRPSCTEHAMLGDNSSECLQVTKLREQVLHARGPRLSALSASCADLASLWTQLRHRECTRATSGISNKHRNQRRNLPRHVGKLACRVHSTPQISVIGPLSRTTE